MKRIYQSVIEKHLHDYQQMVILAGPRNIGKTKLGKEIVSHVKNLLYLNWNDISHREIILSDPEKIYRNFRLSTIGNNLPIIFFDNLNYYKKWKNLLKGYYDVLAARCKFMVAVSEKVETYRAGQDSMLGRYFSYRIHPFTVAELCRREDFSIEYTLPHKIPMDYWNSLISFGGFPEPLKKNTKSFHTRWSNNYRTCFVNTDMRELANVNDSYTLDLLIQMLQRNVGSLVNFSKIARDLQTTVPTIQHWHNVLSNHYYCFALSPWPHNIKRSLQKIPKFYLYDWSQVADKHRRIENLLACHLNKAVDFWNDIGLGSYELYYLRDKEQHEVDFLIVKNKKPWIMIDIKSSERAQLNPSLLRFHEQLKVPYVFQAVVDMQFIDKDCFLANKPVVVPLKTFLSQLV